MDNSYWTFTANTISLYSHPDMSVSKKQKMESSVDWTSVDMLVSQLTEVLSPQEDAETVQEAVSILNFIMLKNHYVDWLKVFSDISP